MNEGITLLTAHKSKGLEFEHLIVCDRLKGERNKQRDFIFEFDEIELKRVYRYYKNREFVDNDFKNALEAEKLKEKEDIKNRHYVAFSRAKNTLIVIKSKEKSGFEDISLKPCKIGEIVASKKQKSKKRLESIENFTLKIPKQNIDKKIDSKEESSVESIYFGIATHYALEKILLFEKSHIKKAVDLTRFKFGLFLNKDDFDTIEATLIKLFNNPTFKRLTKGEIEKERVIKYKNSILKPDLIVKNGDNYTIIDYKTSSFVKESHLFQLKLYKEAFLSRFENVKAFLCYLGDNINFKEI